LKPFSLSWSQNSPPALPLRTSAQAIVLIRPGSSGVGASCGSVCASTPAPGSPNTCVGSLKPM
jgi:hypothetical protein